MAIKDLQLKVMDAEHDALQFTDLSAQKHVEFESRYQEASTTFEKCTADLERKFAETVKRDKIKETLATQHDELESTLAKTIEKKLHVECWVP